MPLALSIGESTATGPRVENQDALRSVTPAPALATSKGHLVALADGVSQCADGGLAARSTVQALALDYYSTPETWPIAQSLDRLLLAQNRWLHAGAQGQPLLTTLTALVFRGHRYTLAHVGDCRAYHFRDATLRCLTEDHVWQQPGMQHVLTRALGLESHLVVDFREGDLQSGDCFLLVSDGVWAVLGDAAIRRILLDETDPVSAAQALTHAAHLAGSQDNASALLVRIDALPDKPLADALADVESWPAPPRLKEGQRFEGWHVEQRIAASQQSWLYRVRDEAGRAWLLKTLPPDHQDDIHAAQALLMEEWFLRRVAGRAFVELHPLPKRQHLYYVQREYTGSTLAVRLKQEGPLPLGEWLDTTTRLLQAVGQLHRRNILHRDIKPENLHRGNDGELRLLDFGLAYCPGLSRQAEGTVPGTPTYLAPEAFEGASPTPQQDLFSVGVTLYHLLTEHYPYGEIEAFQRPRFHLPQSVLRYRPDIPVWLNDWLLHCVAANPTERFETAEEALLTLEQNERQPMPRPKALLERAPLTFWRSMACASLLLNVLLALIWLSRH
jgi:serine/threonine protein phosphatase PrpC